MTSTLLRRIIPTSLVLCMCSSALAQEGTLVVANRGGGSISLIDLETRLEVARVPVGPIIPHEVSVSPDGRFALTGLRVGQRCPSRRPVRRKVRHRMDFGRPGSRETVLLTHFSPY